MYTYKGFDINISACWNILYILTTDSYLRYLILDKDKAYSIDLTLVECTDDKLYVQRRELHTMQADGVQIPIQATKKPNKGILLFRQYKFNTYLIVNTFI